MLYFSSYPVVCPPLSVGHRHRDSFCWSHPGTYFGALGLQSFHGIKILIEAGSAHQGFDQVLWNGATMAINETQQNNDQTASMHYVSSHRMVTTAGLYELSIDNSDEFLSIMSITVNDWTALIETVQSHGLIGQTWRQSLAAEYREILGVESLMDDYAQPTARAVSSNKMRSDLFSAVDHYNKFHVSA